ncbi:hypothetical protein ACGFY3_09695 [Streptomyces mirabilis]
MLTLEHTFDAQGRLTSVVTPDGTRRRYTYDPETGLHYNYFRHYDPETGW